MSTAERNTKYSILQNTFVITVIALSVPVLLPFIQLGVFYQWWLSYKILITRDTCSCSCWDTIFKGSYESVPAGYKHVYFNATVNTFVIWVITIVAVVVVYEVFKHLLTLLAHGKLRYSMAFLIISSIYPHYYSWWSMFNWFNDDYYEQLLHQAVFTVTECLSTMFVCFETNADRRLSARRQLSIIVIAMAHILAASGDQFVENVLVGAGAGYQRARDVGFMVDDVFHVAVPYMTLHWMRSTKTTSGRWTELISTDEAGLAAVGVVLLWLLIMIL